MAPKYRQPPLAFAATAVFPDRPIMDVFINATFKHKGRASYVSWKAAAIEVWIDQGVNVFPFCCDRLAKAQARSRVTPPN